MTVPFDIARLHAAYCDGFAPDAMLDLVFERLDQADDPGIFIEVAGREALAHEIAELGPFDPVAKPLWGVPFAIKDNIDAAGFSTTAACPAFSYAPGDDAEVVRRLRAAGAIAIGKTNLDQYATGLVGTRTPYPAPRNALDPALVPGGSSSGSAVAVALGIVSFALGTDTAGSGRVPAALNNIVGLKPSLGWLSTRGVVPACRTLDCVSVFALTVEDGSTVAEVAGGFDEDDPFSRRIDLRSAVPGRVRVAIPREDQLEFFGNADSAAAFERAVARLSTLGCEVRQIDFSPFREAAALLYQGAWLAERYLVIADLLERDPAAVHPVTRKIIEPGRDLAAVRAFSDRHRLAELRRASEGVWREADVMAVPTIPGAVTLADDARDSVGPNTRLGTYTNFVNLLDLCALAVPSELSDAMRASGITLVAPAGQDRAIADLAQRFHASAGLELGATGWSLPVPSGERGSGASTTDGGEVELFVVGAHLAGEPLNRELVDLDARLVGAVQTAPTYRLFDLCGGKRQRPGMLRSDVGGATIEGETWSMSIPAFGAFVASARAPLTIGTVELADGRFVKGFVVEAVATRSAIEITAYGGWRAYLAAPKSSTSGENALSPPA